MQHQDFSCWTVLVVGASSGIGRDIAGAFARAGATVALAGRRQELDETTDLVRAAGAEALAIVADVTDEASVEALLARIGALHVAVNAAGIVDRGNVDEMSLAAFARVMEVNVTGLWLSMKYELRALKASDGSAIVNIGSNQGARLFLPGMSAYAASKAAVSSLTRTAALEAIPFGIRVNCLCPGPVDTPLSIRAGEDAAARDARVAATNPSRRCASTHEIAAAAPWLASADAAYIVGQDIVIDGGATV